MLKIADNRNHDLEKTVVATALIVLALTSLVALPAAAAPGAPDRGVDATPWYAGLTQSLTGFWDVLTDVWDRSRNFVDPDGTPSSNRDTPDAFRDESRNFVDPDGTPSSYRGTPETFRDESRNFVDPDGAPSSAQRNGAGPAHRSSS